MTQEINNVHFIGVCGTAMASTAAAMKERGFNVTGSDEGVYPPMSDFLAERGIEVKSPFRPDNIPEDADLIVIGNAMSRGNPEVELTLASRHRYISLPELLKEFFIRGKRSIVVTGTHGKTTTTSLLTWVFEHNGLNPGYMLGGVPNNLKQGARFTDSEWFIIEGDEYDTAFFDKRSKFVHYLPEIAIVNNVEFDHADIFENLAAIKKSFSHFIRLVPNNGLLLANGDDENLKELLAVDFCPVRRFGLGEGNEARVEDVSYSGEGACFRLGATKFSIPMVGEFNVRNAAAVALAARAAGIGDEGIQSAFSSFEGIKRRMEVFGEADGVTVIDDFGHHPTAIAQTLEALREKYRGRRLWAVFEPRSNTTRRNVFQDELAKALSLADCVVVAEVARLELLAEEQRLDPTGLMTAIEDSGTQAAYLPTVDAIVEHVSDAAVSGDVICVFSNGGFGGVHQKLLDALKKR